MQQSAHHPPLSADHMVIGGTCTTNRSNNLMDSRLMSRRHVLAGMASLCLAGGAMSFLEACGSSSTASPHAKLNKPILGTTLLTYRGHAGSVYAVVWSPDGKRIASGSSDHTVQVWDAATGGHVFTYRGQTGNLVNAAAWSPDGTRIASGGGDDTVQVWQAS